MTSNNSHPPSQNASLASKLYHGASWYPEQWDENLWIEDLRLMKELGLNVVRVAEFSWSKLESREGEFDFSWLLRALDLVSGQGISAIIGTPSAAPPQWLMLKHPEISYIDPTGYRHPHGGRQHACYNNPTFRSHANRVAKKMAQALGQHKSLVGWQVDNELRGHQKLCVCPGCHHLWADWLERRYQKIDQLNREWGTEVWSNRFESFKDVPTPSPLPCWSHHFSLLLNYRRFMSDSAIGFAQEQVNELRKFSEAPVTHNSENSVDEYDLFQGLDFASADIYLEYLGGVAGLMRIDSLRSVKPGFRFWTMETGFEGSLGLNPPTSDCLSCFALMNYTGGAQAFVHWPWRQLRSGTEIEHHSVIYSNGQPTPSLEAIKTVAELRQKLEPLLQIYAPSPADVALVRSEQNGHYFYSDKVAGLEPNFSYQECYLTHYRALLDAGAWRDVIFDEASLEQYKIIFSPYLPFVSPNFLKKMLLHLNKGGTWVIGPYCGYRDQDHTVPSQAIYGEVERFMGFKTRYFHPSTPVGVSLMDGSHGVARMRISAFIPQEGDEVLGSYTEGRFAGQAWGLTRACHGGRIYLLGSELEHKQRLYESILDRENIPRHPLPDQVTRVPLTSKDGTTAWALSNWDSSPKRIQLPHSGIDLLTSKHYARELDLAPYASVFLAFGKTD